jgi:hypothetical protein
MAKTTFDRRSALKVMGGAGAAGLALRTFPTPAITQGAPVIRRSGNTSPKKATSSAAARSNM